MSMERYFERVSQKINALSDDEFMELLEMNNEIRSHMDIDVLVEDAEFDILNNK